jgi:hypothetical protein
MVTLYLKNQVRLLLLWLVSDLPEVVVFSSGQGRNDAETEGVAALR